MRAPLFALDRCARCHKNEFIRGDKGRMINEWRIFGTFRAKVRSLGVIIHEHSLSPIPGYPNQPGKAASQPAHQAGRSFGSICRSLCEFLKNGPRHSLVTLINHTVAPDTDQSQVGTTTISTHHGYVDNKQRLYRYRRKRERVYIDSLQSRPGHLSQLRQLNSGLCDPSVPRQ